jgi:hypothetical protein
MQGYPPQGGYQQGYLPQGGYQQGYPPQGARGLLLPVALTWAAAACCSWQP